MMNYREMDKQPADWRAEVRLQKCPIDQSANSIWGGTIANQIFLQFASANIKSLGLVLEEVER